MTSAATLAAPTALRPASPKPRVPHIVAGDLSRRTEAELIATVLAGPEPASEVMRFAELLARLPFWQRRALGVEGLVREHGVPRRHAVRLVALWVLAERWFPDQRPSIHSARDALLLLSGQLGTDTERIVALLLDARQRPITVETIAVGTVNCTRLQSRDVIVPALRAGAAAVIVAHNHPSGDPAPSTADRRTTAALRQATTVVGLPLVDHIVVARHGHYSFAREERWHEAGNGFAYGDG